MIIFPAIDVLDNRAVRLYKGERAAATDYGDPVEAALRWEAEGAEYLHVVNLNGAFDDSAVNDATLKRLLSAVKIPVQVGGGVKSEERAKFYLEELGAARVIIGTACATNPDMTARLCAKFGADKIVGGIDVKDGRVALKGWVESRDVTPSALAERLAEIGISLAVFTDVSRDGAMCGVNLAATRKLCLESGLRLIASGGMANIADVTAVRDAGLYGAILGKSLYGGAIVLKDALSAAKGEDYAG